MKIASKFAQIIYNNQQLDLPVYTPTLGPEVVDVTSLYKQLKIFTFDPGYMSTASCSSAITFIDGEAGVLMHRGIKIEELARKYCFLDVAYLVLFGNLPNNDEKSKFIDELAENCFLEPEIMSVFINANKNSHPMSILMSATSALSGIYADKLQVKNAEDRRKSAIILIAKFMLMVANSYRLIKGESFCQNYLCNDYVANFLKLFLDKDCEDEIVQAMDKILLLHIDHEQNASTSTVRTIGSTGVNPFAAIVGGLASLWGPAHGGANEAVVRMLEKIATVENIPSFINKVKNQQDGAKLMGFGHRVYKNYDPRAAVIRSYTYKIFEKLDNKSAKNLLELAYKLEEIALNDEYFKSRKLYPNVDFYSGLIYKGLQIQPELYTPLFALARVVGWMAQWCEMQEDPGLRIFRPRQLYIGKR